MSEYASPPPSVLVLGLGTSGLAMARWCVNAGLHVTVADTRAAPPQLAQLQKELPGTSFVCAAFEPDLLLATGAGLVLKSPGIAPHQLTALCAAATAAGIAIAGELGVFAKALEGLRASRGYQPVVLAITGTNGKTTVTALTGHLVARAGKSVAIAGNIGPTLLDTLGERLATSSLPDVWVIELSSFQLADNAATGTTSDMASSFEPTAGCVLNLTQDHLDWHGSMQAYAQAKAAVLGRRSVMVLNRDDPLVMAMVPAPQRGQTLRAMTSFGDSMPRRPGDFGIEEVNGMAWLVRALELDPTIKVRRGQEAAPNHIQRLIPAEALRIQGRHNACNALAALALASAAGCPLAPMLYGLREYRGEPHRVESLGVFDEVEYFDDSKGTNVGATVAAVKGLGAQRKLVVILGGDGKGQDFSPLATPLARHGRAAVLIGRDAGQIQQALESSGVPMVVAPSMHEAVRQARTLAHPGDAVLLSPACASLDMFDNYIHRARVYAQAVTALAHETGTPLEAMQ